MIFTFKYHYYVNVMKTICSKMEWDRVPNEQTSCNNYRVSARYLTCFQ